MKVLVVVAHPEPGSLTKALTRSAIEMLEADGHTVKVSDLYAMNFKAVVDRADFLHLDALDPSSVDPDSPGRRLKVGTASGEATRNKTLTPDVVAEQEKLLWSDFVLLAFPLWWYSSPAILKGWVDRVFSFGFAYGINKTTPAGKTLLRYGEGPLSGRRAMLLVMVGGWADVYSARGITGPIEDRLYNITHGVLHYVGIDILPSFVVYQSDRVDEDTFLKAEEALKERLRTVETTKPIPYRKQNDGDYEIPSYKLKEGLEDEGASGFALHRRKNDEDPDVLRSVSAQRRPGGI